jgi:hypothetical protein
VPDYGGRVRRLADHAFQSGGRATWRRQLRSATLLGQIRQPDTPVPSFTFDALEIARVNDLVRLAELTRSPRERRADPGQLPVVAQTYADLADRFPHGVPRRAELLALAASTWSLAGYQANAAALADDYLSEIGDPEATAALQVQRTADAAPAAIAVLAGAMLRRDVAQVTRLGAASDLAVRQLGRRFLEEAGDAPLDRADSAVLAVYGLVGRAARRLARFWQLGDRTAGYQAVEDLRRASRHLLDASVVDTWVLVDNLAHVVEDAVAVSPWRLLRRTTNWNGLWERYLRALAIGDHPVVQVWPSQRAVLDKGLLDRDAANLTVSMPTSAGKTHIAEWAILHALAEPSGGLLPRLAVYVVPSRALAGEVERHLAASLGLTGLRISGLFGGSEHVDYELRLIATTDVLVVTSEKFDLLLRNDDTLAERLALVVADEGHLLGEGDRGLRLEMVLTRIRRIAPNARVLVLSAVLPNASEIASWLAPAGTEPRSADVSWSPSRLRIGVFTWRGQETDGQQGFVEYRADDAEPGFFLPYVLTRHIRRTRLFPTEKSDIAAALALHYQQLGSVLIAVPKKASAATAARAVMAAARNQGVSLGTDDSGVIPAEVAAQRERVAEAVAEFAGGNHELAAMARAGVGYHHADVPEVIRQELERAYRCGAIKVLCATSTLGQGVNLPAKTVVVSGTWRDQDDEIPVRDFLNVAGRAGRPFRETEGHVILVAGNPREATRLRRKYVDNPQPEPILSTLARLYMGLVKARLGHFPDDAARVPDDLELADPADDKAAGWADALDLQLLTLLAEEVVDTADERLLTDAVQEALTGTLGAYQLGAERYTLVPMARFAVRRVRAVVARVPDAAQRDAYLRTGLSLNGCESALSAAHQLIAAIEADPGLLEDDQWERMRSVLLAEAVKVTEIQRACAREGADPGVLADLAASWIDAYSIDELRQRFASQLGITDPMRFVLVLDRLVVHDLAWVLSAVLQLCDHEREQPLHGPVTASAAMAKYGVNTEYACFAASVGVRSRHDAMALGQMFAADNIIRDFPNFLAWASGLDPDTIRDVVGARTAELFIDRTATLLTPRTALDLAIRESGTLSAPLRGIRPMGTAGLLDQVTVGDEVYLQREHGNAADVNAIAVHLATGEKVAYLAREVARVLAPLADLDGGPQITATLATRPPPGDDTHARLERHDAIKVNITVVPRPPTPAKDVVS